MSIMRLLFPNYFAERDKAHAEAAEQLEAAVANSRQTRQVIQSSAHVLRTMSGAMKLTRDSRGQANG